MTRVAGLLVLILTGGTFSYAGVLESLTLTCKVKAVNSRNMAGQSEGILKPFVPGLDTRQIDAFVSIIAGTKQRLVKIGKSHFDREARDRSQLEYTRSANGDYRFVVYSGNVEEFFVIRYSRDAKTATVASGSSDFPKGDDPESHARVYADLDCRD